MRPLPWLDPARLDFPPGARALDEPPGLLAAGGDLRPERLERAYALGIFPWYEDGSPILWWCPAERAVIEPSGVRISRSLRKRLRRKDYAVTMDRSFEAVIRACAGPRAGAHGTWITGEMIDAYLALHARGSAHSVEVWMNGELAGGLYGVCIGRCFFGESMFTHRTDASKIAFVHLLGQLALWNFPLVDCQMPNPHLDRLGVGAMARDAFLARIAHLVTLPGPTNPWQMGYAWPTGTGEARSPGRKR
ncbi:MAG: leucyl/phenylalanyl-tRNA--protein transferase [Pseudomonadales bacterium]|nr:leucyl/phenylalanyl-tRNA--protein transferase [Pseudomonadales bacterium]